MSRIYFRHRHEDYLGSVSREGSKAICPGCDRVVKARVEWGHGWWQDMLWPWSEIWRRRLDRL